MPAVRLPALDHDKIAAFLAALPGTAEYANAVEQFTSFPPQSLMNSGFRALVYLMVRALSPKHVIEIGTLFAGTSRIFVEALAANGSGRLTTIDPFGGDRVPPIIATWPAELQEVTTFRPVYSAELFSDLGSSQERADFIFVDGNHDYEFALFDLLSAARWITPGGIIIMDNMDLPGVIAATRRFEADNPDWTVVKFSAHPAMGSRQDRSSLDQLHRIYVAPLGLPVGILPVEFNTGNLAADGLSAITLELGQPSPGGILHYQVYFRTIPWRYYAGEGTIEEFAATGTVTVAEGMRELIITLPIAMVTARPHEGFNRRVATTLLFEDGGRGNRLMLAKDPIPTLVGGDWG